jgi:hypothetical protein
MALSRRLRFPIEMLAHLVEHGLDVEQAKAFSYVLAQMPS